jgi:GT2 family glycosyltransferase/glycosyltransferase involved in cell wall biosynthesis
MDSPETHRPRTCGAPRGVDIIIPFYRTPELVQDVFQALGTCSEELAEIGGRIVAVDDSGDGCLTGALDCAKRQLERIVPCEIIRNESNYGFVRSANTGLHKAVEAERDVILLNSDTKPFDGAFGEMQAVAYLDPMIGFVSPRSNNATICSLPHQAEFHDLPPATAHRIFTLLSRYLPRFQYAPTAVGFCMYIKWPLLKEFGLLDEVYGRGYNEENDLIMRSNRCGYRAAIANRAFVYHAGEKSFTTSKTKLDAGNATILSQRYPEYLPSIHNYMSEPAYRAECLLAGLIPDSSGKVDVLFDLSNLRAAHNGTFQSACEILRHASRGWTSWCNVFVLAPSEAYQFHKLDKIRGLYFARPDTSRSFAAVFHFGQPFDVNRLATITTRGVVNCWVMLDTIAWDCQYLANPLLDRMWRFVCGHSDGILYISQFVQDQFRRRFPIGQGVKELALLLSLNTREYGGGDTAAEPTRGEHLLIVGNHYEHKFVRQTADAVCRALPLEKVVVLGVAGHPGPKVVCYESGQMSDSELDDLFRRAKCVIYPSHYEGFGMPVVKALAFKKPVFARDIPAMQEISSRLTAGGNIVLYTTTTELTAALADNIPEWQPVRLGAQDEGWEYYSERVGQFVKSLLESDSIGERLRFRLQELDHLLAAGTPSSDSSHLSQMTVALQQKNAQIEDIYRSYSWRITAPLRWIGRWPLKAFSKKS